MSVLKLQLFGENVVKNGKKTFFSTQILHISMMLNLFSSFFALKPACPNLSRNSLLFILWLYLTMECQFQKRNFLAKMGAGGENGKKKIVNSNLAYFNDVELFSSFLHWNQHVLFFPETVFFLFYDLIWPWNVSFKNATFKRKLAPVVKTAKKTFFSTQILAISTMLKFFLVFCIETIISQCRIIRGGHNSFRLFKFLNSP